jgi:hypothetical protein
MKNHFKQFKDTDWLFVAVALIAAAAVGGVYLFLLAIGLLVAFFKPFSTLRTLAPTDYAEDLEEGYAFHGQMDDGFTYPAAGGYWSMGVFHPTDD